MFLMFKLGIHKSPFQAALGPFKAPVFFVCPSFLAQEIFRAYQSCSLPWPGRRKGHFSPRAHDQYRQMSWMQAIFKTPAIRFC